MTFLSKTYFIFFPMLSIAATTLNAQQPHFKNTTRYLQQARVTERSTLDVTEGKKQITLDRFENGNKIETFEYYYGNRYLSKFNGSEWTGFHDTTHYGFSYDDQGRQIYQLNFDFNKISENHMYQYDEFGNIERWITGRSFQLSHATRYIYDKNGTVIQERKCWADSCFKTNNITETNHHVKYDSRGLLIEDLVNYVDGMAGYQYEYIFDQAGRLLNKKQYRVWSYFGLDHEVPTAKDIDRTQLYYSWAYEYNALGSLVKETRIDHWMESDYTMVHKYNHLNLISETLIEDVELIKYSYAENGLLTEEKHYDQRNGKDKLTTRLQFEYVYSPH